MRFILILVTFSLLLGSVSAECKDKDCMPDSYEFGNYGHVNIYYNSVFEIGKNWFIIIELNQTEEYYDFNFEFEEGSSKGAHLEDMSDNPDVKTLIQKEVDTAMASFSNYERVKEFSILPRLFTIEDGELTPKLSVKRKVVLEHFAEYVEKNYIGNSQESLDSKSATV